MSQNLYQEASQRVINNFHYILETMDKITEKELQNEFLMWRSEYGIGNLIKNFLFTQEPNDLESKESVKKDDKIDGISQYLKSQEEQNPESNFELPVLPEKFQKKSKKGKYYKRGPYRKYTEAEKTKAVDMYRHDFPLTKISRYLNIPIKNIKRWSEQESQKQDHARNSMIELEQALYKNIIDGVAEHSQLELQEVRKRALCMSEEKEFKASESWAWKFVSKFKLDRLYSIIG